MSLAKKTDLASILQNRIGSRGCVAQILRVHAQSSRSFCVLKTGLLVGALGTATSDRISRMCHPGGRSPRRLSFIVSNEQTTGSSGRMDCGQNGFSYQRTKLPLARSSQTTGLYYERLKCISSVGLATIGSQPRMSVSAVHVEGLPVPVSTVGRTRWVRNARSPWQYLYGKRHDNFTPKVRCR